MTQWKKLPLTDERLFRTFTWDEICRQKRQLYDPCECNECHRCGTKRGVYKRWIPTPEGKAIVCDRCVKIDLCLEY